MARVLKIILVIEVALGLVWTLVGAMAHGPGGLGAIGVMLVVYAIFAVFFLVAVWAFWRSPPDRRLAVWIMVLPFVFWCAPFIIRWATGDHLSTEQLTSLLVLTVVGFLIACWLMPKRINSVIPDGLIRSRVFNWLILLSVIAGWLFFAGAVACVATENTSSTSGGEGLGLAILIAALYLIWLGIGSFVAATWAWLCMRSNVDDRPRRLSVAQLICSVPGALFGIAIAVWLSAQGHL